MFGGSTFGAAVIGGAAGNTATVSVLLEGAVDDAVIAVVGVAVEVLAGVAMAGVAVGDGNVSMVVGGSFLDGGNELTTVFGCLAPS